MKLPDANVLIYAFDSSSPRHTAANQWLSEVLSGTETVAFSWSVLLAFMRLTTNPAVMSSPISADEAIDVIELWLAQPCASVVHPTDRHAAVLRDLLSPLGTTGNLTSDAHLAALAIEHGAELCSSDSDFGRFAGLKWTDPLLGAKSQA